MLELLRKNAEDKRGKVNGGCYCTRFLSSADSKEEKTEKETCP